MIRGYSGVRSPSWLQAQLLANLGTLGLINCKAWKDLSCIGQLPNLKNLYVEGMPAVKQTSHELSTESKFLPNLEELVLKDMVALEELPSLGQLPCLKVLRIERMPAVTKVGHGFFGCRDQGTCFPCLEELVFSDMPAWEEWSWADGRELFPCLRKLQIVQCLRLKRLPPLPPPLETLRLDKVGLTESCTKSAHKLWLRHDRLIIQAIQASVARSVAPLISTLPPLMIHTIPLIRFSNCPFLLYFSLLRLLGYLVQDHNRYLYLLLGQVTLTYLHLIRPLSLIQTSHLQLTNYHSLCRGRLLCIGLRSNESYDILRGLSIMVSFFINTLHFSFMPLPMLIGQAVLMIEHPHRVARSTTEAEYRVIAITTAELNWVANLLKELNINSTPTIYCANIGATYLCANPVFYSYYFSYLFLSLETVFLIRKSSFNDKPQWEESSWADGPTAVSLLART
ncbi:unnamed protein product [Musa hybrid cultivar]